MKNYIGKNFFSLDVTVFPEVDSLHHPRGCIKTAQELMADAYGVKNSFFLINGSTSGNIAMLLSSLNPGDSVIVSRNAHKSVLSGIILSGVWPIWIQPKIDQDLDIILNSSAEAIEKALIKFPEAKAVFITSPTYNGVVTDLDRIAEIVHAHGKLLLVDEAHGAHLNFHPSLPRSATQAGADMIVQSIHKTLGAISQGSVVHYNSEMIDLKRVQKVVSLLQSTSPCYPILASLDIARNQMVNHGRKLLERELRSARYARRKINAQERVFCFRKTDLPEGYSLDPTKLTINTTKLGISGFEVSELLTKNYNIQVDCADLFNIIAIMGIGTNYKDVQKLVESLGDIETKNIGESKNWEMNLPSLSTEMVFTPRDVMLSYSTKKIPLKRAAGFISAETLCPYPPGIPVLIPGERITPEIRDYLLDLDSRRIQVVGQEGKRLKQIKVVDIQRRLQI